MTIFKKAVLAASLLLAGGVASASNMYIDMGSNAYDYTFGPHTADADSTTGTFFEFGFNSIRATSLYDMSDGSIFGSFYDTNMPGELSAAGIPTSGTALDGITPVSLIMPNYASGEADLDSLDAIVPPASGDSEGFLTTWDLQVLYHFDGTLSPTGPTYTGGTFQVYFNDFATAGLYDSLVLSGDLTGSTVALTNLDLFFEVTFAVDNFLYIDRGGGVFLDAHDMIGAPVSLHLDTNVNPPIPTPDQLLLVATDTQVNAIRQTTLDGSITAAIPEPGTLALLGISLIGLGTSVFRRKSA